MNPILIVILILTLWYLWKNNTAEPFSQFAPVDWKKESAARCAALKEDAKQIQVTMQSCSATDMYGQRDNINNKIACLDAVNRQIFNDRESGSWCASAKGEKTETKEVLGAQPTNIVLTASKIEPSQVKVTVVSEKKNESESENKTIVPNASTSGSPLVVASELLATKPTDMVAVAQSGGVLNKNFDLIDSIGFNGHDTSKAYAAY